jgi:hypothetical protein
MESLRARATTSFPPEPRRESRFPDSSFLLLVSTVWFRSTGKAETGSWDYGVTVNWNGTLLLNEPEVAVTVIK